MMVLWILGLPGSWRAGWRWHDESEEDTVGLPVDQLVDRGALDAVEAVGRRARGAELAADAPGLAGVGREDGDLRGRVALAHEVRGESGHELGLVAVRSRAGFGLR